MVMHARKLAQEFWNFYQLFLGGNPLWQESTSRVPAQGRTQGNHLFRSIRWRRHIPIPRPAQWKVQSGKNLLQHNMYIATNVPEKQYIRDFTAGILKYDFESKSLISGEHPSFQCNLCLFSTQGIYMYFKVNRKLK